MSELITWFRLPVRVASLCSSYPGGWSYDSFSASLPLVQAVSCVIPYISCSSSLFIISLIHIAEWYLDWKNINWYFLLSWSKDPMPSGHLSNKIFCSYSHYRMYLIISSFIILVYISINPYLLFSLLAHMTIYTITAVIVEPHVSSALLSFF